MATSKRYLSAKRMQNYRIIFKTSITNHVVRVLSLTAGAIANASEPAGEHDNKASVTQGTTNQHVLTDGDHYDPYAIYGRLPMPGRGFPPPPAPNARHMFIGEWD